MAASGNTRPTPLRAMERAMVLATVVCRGYVEQQHEELDNAAELCEFFPQWIETLELGDELEPQEAEFLATSPGQAQPRDALNATWRGEGLAVLAWALNRFSLPPFDQPNVPPDPSQESVGWGDPDLAAELLESAALRPAAEIDRFASEITVVHWRLRQFRLAPGPMDYVAYLRAHPAFKPRWLEKLPIIKNDLAIGGCAIAEAPPDQVSICEGIAVERSVAAFWLQGDHPIYSRVDPATILSAA